MAIFKKKQLDIDIEKTGHIVVLDQLWYRIFSGSKAPRITLLEAKLKKLLKEQGKVNTDYKAYKVLKKQMMAEIVEGMDEAFNKNNQESASRLKKNEKNIKEINKKIELYENKQSTLPLEIEAVNKELLKESMYLCYERLATNKGEKDRVDEQIIALKHQVSELQKKKESMESESNDLYHFIHTVASIDVIEQYDRFYFGKESSK